MNATALNEQYEKCLAKFLAIESNGTKITIKQQNDSFSLLDDFEKIVIPLEYSTALGWICLQKTINKPINLKILLNEVGGFYKLVSTIDGAVNAPFLDFQQEVFISHLNHFLLKVQTIIERYRQKSASQSEIYCCMCWREISSSHYYCSEHNPEINGTKIYYRDRRKILNYLNKNNIKVPEKSNEYAVFFGNQLAQIGRHKDRPLVPKLANFSVVWHHHIDQLIQYMKNNLPLTYSTIEKVSFYDCNSIVEYGTQILNRLHQNASPDQELDLPNWSNYSCQENILRELYPILERHESYQVITTTPTKRGPQKGQVQRNEKLRNRINELLVEGLNKSEIARILEISRARVSQITKVSEQ